MDRPFENGVWHFCVCHQASGPVASGQAGAKVDSRVELDTPTFALFSRLPRSQGSLGEVPRIGEARVQKFGARLLEVIAK